MRHGVRQGKGKCTWKDGSVYDGDWWDGMRQGEGTMNFANGEIYQGQWKIDQMHGQGQLTRRDKTVIKGNWMSGVLQGNATIKDTSGGTQEVRFRDGQQVIVSDKNVRKGRTWTCGIVCNTAMVLIGVGCGLGAMISKD